VFRDGDGECSVELCREGPEQERPVEVRVGCARGDDRCLAHLGQLPRIAAGASPAGRELAQALRNALAVKRGRDRIMETANPWNEIFRREGKVFVRPHEAMPVLVGLLKAKAPATVLDLGCGNGRHVVYLAQQGFRVFGLDSSPEALALTREWLETEGLTADLRLQSMTERLPYADDFFDAVISIQVIHHAGVTTIRRIVQEIRRILRRDGLVCITVSKPKATPRWQHVIETEPRTYLPLEGRENGLLHHQFTPDELRELFAEFDVVSLERDSTDHYCLVAFKR
jgi:SAM-dependent methyltransferase